MKKEKPLISVIMSNYNTSEEYLRASVESVLSQNYENFEFIIVDDCSTDNSLEIIKSYTDKRITILVNEQNLGITKSLNRGLSAAKGEYIARMDADDICLPERFEKQVEFLRKNPQVIACGTGVELIGDWQERHSKQYLCREIPERELFGIYLLFGNYPNIVHPTAMFNKALLDKNNVRYNEKYPVAQDYKMWVDCCKFGECVNLKETLLFYRVHKGAVSSGKADRQRESALMNMAEQLKELHIELTPEKEDIHYNFLIKRHPYDLQYREWILYIIEKNKTHKKYNQQKLEKVLWDKWAETTYFALTKAKNPINALKILRNLPLPYWKELLNIRKRRKKKD